MQVRRQNKRRERGKGRINITILKGRNKIIEHKYQTKAGSNPARQTTCYVATHLLSKLSDGPCSPASLPVCTSLYPWMVALPVYSSPQQIYQGYCIFYILGFQLLSTFISLASENGISNSSERETTGMYCMAPVALRHNRGNSKSLLFLHLFKILIQNRVDDTGRFSYKLRYLVH